MICGECGDEISEFECNDCGWEFPNKKKIKNKKFVAVLTDEIGISDVEALIWDVARNTAESFWEHQIDYVLRMCSCRIGEALEKSLPKYFPYFKIEFKDLNPSDVSEVLEKNAVDYLKEDFVNMLHEAIETLFKEELTEIINKLSKDEPEPEEPVKNPVPVNGGDTKKMMEFE